MTSTSIFLPILDESDSRFAVKQHIPGVISQNLRQPFIYCSFANQYNTVQSEDTSALFNVQKASYTFKKSIPCNTLHEQNTIQLQRTVPADAKIVALSYWLYLETTDDAPYSVIKTSNGLFSAELNSKTKFCASCGMQVQLQPKTWHHIVHIRNTETVQTVYVDNIFKGNFAVSAAILDGKITIGPCSGLSISALRLFVQTDDTRKITSQDLAMLWQQYPQIVYNQLWSAQKIQKQKKQVPVPQDYVFLFSGRSQRPQLGPQADSITGQIVYNKFIQNIPCIFFDGYSNMSWTIYKSSPMCFQQTSWSFSLWIKYINYQRQGSAPCMVSFRKDTSSDRLSFEAQTDNTKANLTALKNNVLTYYESYASSPVWLNTAISDSAQLYNWNMYTVTYDAQAERISQYINGKLLKQTLAKIDIANNSILQLGGYNQDQHKSRGYVSDFRIYSYVLSQQQVQALYTAHKSIQITEVSVDPLVFYAPLQTRKTIAQTNQSLYHKDLCLYIEQDNIPCIFFGRAGYMTIFPVQYSGIPAPSNNSISVCFWIKPYKSSVDVVYPLMFGYSTSDNSSVKFTQSKNTLNVGNSGNQIELPQQGLWYFICFRYDAQTKKHITAAYYIKDSVLQSIVKQTTYTYNNYFTYISGFNIGSTPWSTQYRNNFNGYFTNLRIYNQFIQDALVLSLASQLVPVHTQFIPEAPQTISDSLVVHYTLQSNKAETGQTFTINNGPECFNVINTVPCIWLCQCSRLDSSIEHIPYGYTSFSISFWFYTAYKKSNYTWFTLFNLGSQTRVNAKSVNVYLYGSDQRIYLYLGGYQLTLQGDSKFTWQKWNHVIVTYDTKRLKFYFNNVKLYDQVTAIQLDPQVLSLGASSNNVNSQYYKGYLGDVRVYSKVLTEAQITQLYSMYKDAAPASDLLLHISGLSLIAQTKQYIFKYDRNDSYLINTVQEDGVPAITFPEGSKYNYGIIDQTYTLPYGLNRPFTLSLWTKLPAKPTQDQCAVTIGIYSSDFNSTKQVGFLWSTAEQRLKTAFNNNSRGLLYNITYDWKAAWYHVAITYDGTTIRVYTNKLLTLQLNTNVYLQPRAMRIGNGLHSYYSDNQYKNGFVSDLRFYSRYLTTEQLQTVYTQNIPASIAQLYTKADNLIVHSVFDGYLPRQALTGQLYQPQIYRQYTSYSNKSCIDLQEAMTIPQATIVNQITVSLTYYIQVSTQNINIITIGELQLNIQNGILQLKTGQQTVETDQGLQEGWELITLVSSDMLTFDLYLGTCKVLTKTFSQALSSYQIVLRSAI